MKQQFQHDPQHYMVLSNLQEADRTAVSAGEPQEEVVGASSPGVAEGVGHGELVTVRAQGVEVRGSRHYFCQSHSYRIVDLKQQGDGLPLEDRVPCSVGINRLPADGWYDAELEVVNNNGSVQCVLRRWLRPGTDVAVEEVQECVGAI